MDQSAVNKRSMCLLNTNLTTNNDKQNILQANLTFNIGTAKNDIHVLINIVYPVFGFLGVIGNGFGVALIRKCGLQKPSNCLLFGLSIADIMFCFSIANLNGAPVFFPRIIPKQEGEFVWDLPYNWAYACFIIAMIMHFTMFISGRVSASITLFIVIERLVAVFLPLRFVSIVTAKRVWIAMLACVIFWLPWVLAQMVPYHFGYYYTPIYDTYGGYLLNKFEAGFWFYFIRNNIMSHVEHTIPLAFISVGCLCIWVKVASTNRARAKLGTGQSKGRSSGQTTRTLVAMCAVFCLYKFVYAAYLTIHSINRKTPSPTELNMFIQHFILRTAFALQPLNSACNVLIYVGLNKKFRNAFITLFKKQS